MYNPYQQYQNNSVMTASPAELTLMLYNGAIKFCNLAGEAIKNKNIAESHKNIMKAQNIIQELRITLDHKYSISEEMERLYVYIYDVLVQANITKDLAKLEEATNMIREFRDTWTKVMKTGRTPAAATR